MEAILDHSFRSNVNWVAKGYRHRDCAHVLVHFFIWEYQQRGLVAPTCSMATNLDQVSN
jgi:hypothetical protein